MELYRANFSLSIPLHLLGITKNILDLCSFFLWNIFLLIFASHQSLCWFRVHYFHISYNFFRLCTLLGLWASQPVQLWWTKFGCQCKRKSCFHQHHWLMTHLLYGLRAQLRGKKAGTNRSFFKDHPIQDSSHSSLIYLSCAVNRNNQLLAMSIF